MSELRANTISDAAGTGPVTLTGQSAAKAWVNFNGTGTVAVRESFNVGSITDNGTGDYTANFSSSLSISDFGAVCNAKNGDNDGLDIGHSFVSSSRTTTSCRLRGGSSTTANADKAIFDLVVMA